MLIISESNCNSASMLNDSDLSKRSVFHKRPSNSLHGLGRLEAATWEESDLCDL